MFLIYGGGDTPAIYHGDCIMSNFIPSSKDQAFVRRSALIDGQLKHYQPEQYHANPLSSKGSLVFYDFGWDLLTWMRDAGLGKVRMCLYWSDTYGYLGDPQFYFHAVKPEPG